ncbi:hypothetical protein CPB85DRAFT_1437835 [Mucidula mucida]|nr:hypothetical protein CPB85DRAFT_1437835 [Mucidula mucida]
MSVPLENINISRTFTAPLVLPIMHARTVLIDCMEYVWGLNRGQMSAYFNVSGNFLQIQPELKDAIVHGKVALVPPNHVVQEMIDFQQQNRKLPFAKRRIFTEVFPFGPSECRVLPLKPGVSLYALNPTTQKVTTLKGTLTSFPSVSCGVIHPLFLMTYSCREVVVPSKSIDSKLGLGNTLIKCFNPWHTTPPLEFYDGAYMGQFGRSIPRLYRPLLPPPVLVHSSSSSSLDSEHSSKRSRLSTPSQSDSESGADIAKWASDCAAADFDPDVGGPALDVVPCKPLDSPEVVRRHNPKRKRS